MALYFEEEHEKVQRDDVFKKKVIRLITSIKNMNPVDRNLKKIKFLW